MADAAPEVRVCSWITPEPMLRGSLGIVYLWFGALKLVGMSPVLSLVRSTYKPLETVPLYIGLAVFELLLGVGLLIGFRRRVVAAAVMGHLLGTFGVLVSCPQVAFLPRFPFLTMEGEFVVKNLVLLAAACAVWVDAGRLLSAETDARRFRRKSLLVGGAVLAVAVTAGIAASRLHHAIRMASRPMSRSVTSTSTRTARLSAQTVRDLTEESGGGSVVLEGILVDRCPLLGCWLKLRDESAEVLVDLAPKGLDIRGIDVGDRIRVTGRIGKTREGTVGFVASRIEPMSR